MGVNRPGENADGCLEDDLLLVSIGDILPERLLNAVVPLKDDFPSSSGVRPGLLTVLPYKSSILEILNFHIWH